MAQRKKITILSINILKKIFDDIITNLDSESELDNEIEKAIIINMKSKTRPRKRKIPRCRNYFKEIVPRYSCKEFQMHFRMAPQAFEVLCQRIIPILRENYHTGQPLKNVEKQILSVIWLLATPDSYRSVGTKFDLGKSSLADAFVRIIRAICRISSDVIQWPRGEKVDTVKNKFKLFAGIENVIGAIDGTYIPIKAPKIDAEVYNTRKCFYAYTLQGISEPSLKFTDAFIGYPGSVSDRRIFTQSNIYKNIELNPDHYFHDESFIVGDKAYPLKIWCIPPYIENRRLNNAEKYFNEAHAKTRQVIERSFALLFGRFRRLKFLDMSRTDFIPATVLACCVLHNICLDYESLLEDYIVEGEEDICHEDNNRDQMKYQLAGQHLTEAKRNAICYHLSIEQQRRN